MSVLLNTHVEDLNDVIREDFNMLTVSKVFTATESVIREMHKELNVDTMDHIRQCHLNKRTVSKEKLAEWLETVCFILDSYSMRLLKNAVKNLLITVPTRRVDEIQRKKLSEADY